MYAEESAGLLGDIPLRLLRTLQDEPTLGFKGLGLRGGTIQKVVELCSM